MINRSRETLLPIITQIVEQGSTIYSDFWSSYWNLRTLPKQSYLEPHGYHHFGVNHSKRFVNSYNRQIHTNTIERLWKSLKELTRTQRPKKKLEYFISWYIFESMVPKKERIAVIISFINELKST